MPQVLCQAVRCAHNLEGHICNAATITINPATRFGRKTECTAFIPRSFTKARVSLENVNYGGLVTQAFSGSRTANPHVECMAKECCFHENEANCIKEEIKIVSPEALTSGDTWCDSYQENL